MYREKSEIKDLISSSEVILEKSLKVSVHNISDNNINMKLSAVTLLLFTFCSILSAQFWTDVQLERMEWSSNCDLRKICTQPTLQLRLINLFNDETIAKILKVNFDQQQSSETRLISYWSEGNFDMIVLTITINGIDPDYDFSRLCDSTGTIFLFRFADVVGDQTHEILSTSLTAAIYCLIICLALIYIFITINRILKLRSGSNSQIKRIPLSKATVFNGSSLNATENSCERERSRVFPISIESGSLDLPKSRIAKFSPKQTLSANSSLCGSIG
uniref:Recep_L_domain domain-containing protein n=1 Tax=Elaeophora elaphi TaxID=1147741 RepID=A0A0R3RH74_9BILA